MGWIVFEIAANCFQSQIIVYLTTNCFRYGRTKLSLPKKALLFLECVSFFSLFLFFPMPPIDVAVFLFPTAFSLLYSDNSIDQILYWNCLFALFFSLVAGLANHVYLSLSALSSSPFPERGWQYVVFIASSNCILYIFSRFIVKQSKFGEFLNRSTYIVFLFIIISIFIAEEAIYYFHQTHSAIIMGDGISFLIVSYLALTLCLLLNVFLLHVMANSAIKESRYQTELTLLSQSQQHQEELTRAHLEMVEYRHDMKHHLQVLEKMVTKEQNKDAEVYLAEIQNDSLQDCFATGSSAVDAILTAKVSAMKIHGISFHYIPYPLRSLPVSTADFCSIIGNLLDNAVEGILRIPTDKKVTREIQLSFLRAGNMFYITCENPCDPSSIKTYNGNYCSSKAKSDNEGIHGIGLRSIERIATQVDGRINFCIDDEVFYAEVVLPFSFIDVGD